MSSLQETPIQYAMKIPRACVLAMAALGLGMLLARWCPAQTIGLSKFPFQHPSPDVGQGVAEALEILDEKDAK